MYSVSAFRGLMSGVMAATVSTAALAAPVYDGATATQCIPFANPQTVSFTNAPRLNVSVGPVPGYTSVQMDTGSVGVALSAGKIPDFQALKARSDSKPGTQYLSSSKILWVGTWVRTTVTLHDAKGAPVAVAYVPVLGVEQAGSCPSYQTDGKICPGLASAVNGSVFYMGVGFGQEADFQPQGTPDKNVLLNLVRLNGQPIADGTLNPGYIIGRQGIQVGLTAANTTGFSFAKLEPYAQYPGDWLPPKGCLVVNPSENGDQCITANVLVDTGIPQSYMTVPAGTKLSTVQAPDASEPKKQIGVLAKGNSVSVSFPATAPFIATDSFTIGGNTPVEPVQVIPSVVDTRPPFINTGRHFLRQYQFLYDAKQGYLGIKAQPNACGEK